MTDSSFDQRILRDTPRLRSFVRRQINSADDLAQETILKALRARDSLRDESRFEGWLYRMARRTIIERRHTSLVSLTYILRYTPPQEGHEQDQDERDR
jgi:RNA polymerase sigma factor (sigma-70 family)